MELKALNIIKSFVISSTWNETGLNLGWVFLGGFTQKTRQPAGFFGYLPGFLNPVCWHGGCSHHCRSAQCQVIRPNSWYTCVPLITFRITVLQHNDIVMSSHCYDIVGLWSPRQYRRSRSYNPGLEIILLFVCRQCILVFRPMADWPQLGFKIYQ